MPQFGDLNSGHGSMVVGLVPVIDLRQRSLRRSSTELSRELREVSSFGSWLSDAPLLGSRGATWAELGAVEGEGLTSKFTSKSDFARSCTPRA